MGNKEKIYFINAFIMREFDRHGGLTGRYFLLEKFMQGHYIKFNSNFDWVNPNVNQNSDIFAFVHFTYNFSGGEYIVLDL